MSDIMIIPIEDIINENYILTGVKCTANRAKMVKGCYSSYHYYSTPQEQITSIVVSLIKNHYFIDGNKRTALSTYIVLSQANDIKYIEDTQKQVDVFVEIATTHKEMSYYVKLLFPK